MGAFPESLASSDSPEGGRCKQKWLHDYATRLKPLLDRVAHVVCVALAVELLGVDRERGARVVVAELGRDFDRVVAEVDQERGEAVAEAVVRDAFDAGALEGT